MLLAFDWEQDRIARALRITAKTLRKHYSRELKFSEEARAALEGAMIQTTFAEALKGDASMMRLAVKMLEKHDMMRGVTASTASMKAPKLGKKEQALKEALEPKTDTPLGELMARRQGTLVN